MTPIAIIAFVEFIPPSLFILVSLVSAYNSGDKWAIRQSESTGLALHRRASSRLQGSSNK